MSKILAQIFTVSNYHINFYSLPVLLTSAAVAALGLWIFFNKKDSLVNISFLVMCLSIGTWFGGLGMMYLSAGSGLAKFWFSVSFVGVTLIASSVLAFTVLYLNKEKQFKYLILLGYVFSVLFYFLFLYSSHFLIGIKKHFWGWYPLYGPASYPFIVQWCAFMMISPWLYVRALRQANASIERQRLKYMLIGFMIGYIGIVDFIATFGFSFYPFGYLPVLCFVAIMAYSVKRYQLLITPSMAADTIVNTMADALIVFDSDGNITSVNPVTQGLFKYERSALMGKAARDLFLEKNLFEQNVLAELAAGGMTRNFEMTALDSSGENIPVSLSIGVIRDDAGQVNGYVCIARDVRVTRLFIEELTRKTQETEKELRERMKAEAELKAAYEKLKTAQDRLLQSEKLAAVGQLAGGVAHEINNPMGVILGFAQVATKDLKENDPLYLPLKSIEREALRCKNLVQDLLTFARSGVEKFPTEKSDINQVIDSALTMVEVQDKTGLVKLEREFGGGLKEIEVNRYQIQQMIMNLCVNAIDAMNGNGKLTVRTMMAASGDVEIQVADTGTGIPDEIKTKIFEPFFTTKEVGEGTGLGLSLVYEIVQQHHGKIDFESKPGRGTIFKITLPAK
jgi:PAS domain S-box-containing protein